MIEVKLEKVDANMEAATVGAWLVEVGQTIGAGDKFVELITDKVTFEYESPVGGMVRALHAPEGSLVPVGFVLMQVGAADEALLEVDAANEALVAAYRARDEVTIELGAAPAGERARPAAGARPRATPAARRLARELGVDLADVRPAAEGGIIGEDDVRAHAGG